MGAGFAWGRGRGSASRGGMVGVDGSVSLGTRLQEEVVGKGGSQSQGLKGGMATVDDL